MCLAVATAVFAGVDNVAAAPCDFVSIGVDTSEASSRFPMRCGEAPGETFTAIDTLISSISVWRDAREALYKGGYRLWITMVDVVGRPQRTRNSFREPNHDLPERGYQSPDEDAVSFRSSIRLTGSRRIFFAVQDYCGAPSDLLDTPSDSYAGGDEWRTSITCLDGCSFLGNPNDHFPSYDLIFTVEFCRSDATPVRRKTWGEAQGHLPIGHLAHGWSRRAAVGDNEDLCPRRVKLMARIS